jgi:addiction module HigA family antidote
MNTPHPGIIVNNELEALGLNLVEASTILDVPEDYLESLCSGKTNLTEECAKSLASFLEEDHIDWLQLQTDFNDLGDSDGEG